MSWNWGRHWDPHYMWPQSSVLSFVYLTLRDIICHFMRTIKQPFGEVYMENSWSIFLTVLWKKNNETDSLVPVRTSGDCSPTDILNILTATCWGPAWGTPPMAKVMRKEVRRTQRRDRASGVPLEILQHLPP